MTESVQEKEMSKMAKVMKDSATGSMTIEVEENVRAYTSTSVSQ